MPNQRFEGKNLDEAMQHAAETLGAERWQLAYGVVLEKRGFLGGMKRVVIEAWINEEAEAPPTNAPVAPLPPVDRDGPVLQTRTSSEEYGPSGGRARGPRAHERASRGAKPERGRGGRGDESRARGPRREGRGRGGEGNEAAPRARGPVQPPPEQGPMSEEAIKVRDWIETVIDLARLDLSVRTEEDDAAINVRLYGRDAAQLLDRNGELLDSMQVLSNKSLVGRSVQKAIELDCEGFKEQRFADLQERARTLADKVRAEKREQMLPAMTPAERRIVHLTLQDDAEVATESRGDGFYKRVAIIVRQVTESTTTE
jgi:predicted RNA-binding protein Jag